MKNYCGNYLLILLFVGIFSLAMPPAASAQLYEPYSYLPLSNPDQLTSEQIGTQSISQDLDQAIAPPPLIITTSSGDMYLYQGDGLKAKYTVDQKGTDSVTYYLDGSPFLLKNEFGETSTYHYEIDGTTVYLINDQGGIVSTETYALGQLMTFQSQGQITYTYDDKGAIISSTDEFGNLTIYEKGRPVKIVSSDGEVVGTYKYSGNSLASFTDQYGNTTYFEAGGTRPTYTTNAEGTVTMVYHYDELGNLDYVINNVTQDTTFVNNGYYAQIVNSEGETIGVYNYTLGGYVSSVSEIGYHGAVVGWTEYDDYGRPIASYNGQGSVVQHFAYDDHGFLFRTVSLGRAVDGTPTILSYTSFDSHGRPDETWQAWSSEQGEYYYRAQTYEYKDNGILGRTWSQAILRDDNGEAILDASGNIQLVATGYTTFDEKGRAAATYNYKSDEQGNAVIDELAQVYTYKQGFLTQVISYGMEGRANGATNYDKYSRPSITLNAFGAETQLYIYGGDGFLSETENKGRNGTSTGHTVYNNYGRPTEVFNQENSLVQTYGYDKYGIMVRSNTHQRGMLTGYTLFNTYSRPTSSYQAYQKMAYEGEEPYDLQWSKVQEYVYQTDDGRETANVVKTRNFGDLETYIGETIMDKYGRQDVTLNDYGHVIQKYSYAKDGFIISTDSKGNNGVSVGRVLFDDYARPVLGFNNTGGYRIDENLITQLRYGVDESVINDSNYQSMFRGLTQTYEYGADGFLDTTKSWGQASELNVRQIDAFFNAYGSQKGDRTYNANFDVNPYDMNGSGGPDGVIDEQDLAVFNEVFAGFSDFFAAYGSSSGDANYNAAFDYDGNGTIDRKDVSAFSKTFTATMAYQPTYTGKTIYDIWGKAERIENAEGAWTQIYEYNERGFLQKSYSLGVQFDENGNTVMNEWNAPVYIRTSETVFDVQSRPAETYKIFNNERSGKIQDYVYEEGFLSSMKNYGQDGYETGHITVDNYGRQNFSYNEFGHKTTSYRYSSQGFMMETSNHGRDGVYLGKTVFNKLGRPTESYNNYGDTRTERGITARFNYNEYGFLASSENFGRNQTKSGMTFFDGYGQATRATNAEGVDTTRYEYDSKGWLERTANVAFQTAPGAPTQTVTYLDPETGETVTANISGYYVATGFTTFNKAGRPEESYSLFNNGMDGEQATPTPVQVYEYLDKNGVEDGFVSRTLNYGKEGEFIGYAEFDRFGRQFETYNEFDEVTSRFNYSRDGFIDRTINYGQNKSYAGTTMFNDLGRPTESYNMYGNGRTERGKVQVFNYNLMTGALDTSTSLGLNQVETNTTYYDVYGKAQTVRNHEGSLVQGYQYDKYGFIERTNNFGDLNEWGNPTLTGYTLYNNASRPVESYSVYKNGATAKVQDFLYNKDITNSPDDKNLAGTAANTGFLTLTINYGDELEFAGYTTFNKQGMQTAAFNNYGEKTSSFIYKDGFMTEARNHGLLNAFLGSTVYDEYNRPVYSTNMARVKTTEFNYNERGFLSDSISYGRPNKDTGIQQITSTTYYDGYGKQERVANHLGVDIQTFEYNERGFITKSINLGWEIWDDGTLNAKESGYTTFDKLSRPVASYSVTQWENYPRYEALSQTFVYEHTVKNRDGSTSVLPTGFVTGAVSYAVAVHMPGGGTFNANDPYNKPVCTDGVADAIGTEVIQSGYTAYDRYGRPSESYNEHDQLVSRNKYDRYGFVTESTNFAKGGAITGKLTYDDFSRPDAAYNMGRALTTEYHYNDVHGQLEWTLNYQGKGNLISRTTFNVYGKPHETYQYFKGSTISGKGISGFQYDAGVTAVKGSNANYNEGDQYNNDGGTLLQRNNYNAFGGMSHTTGFYQKNLSGSPSAQSHTVYDTFSKPMYGYNQAGAKISDYTYDSQGWLYSSTSYGSFKPDGGWDNTSSITYFDRFGRQDHTTNMNGVKQAQYMYNSSGFAFQIQQFVERVSGHTYIDSSGRQIRSFAEKDRESRTDYYVYNMLGYSIGSFQAG